MIQPADYEFLVQFVEQRTGTLLGPGKEFLLQARLIPLAQSWGLGSLHELVDELRRTAASPLGDAVLDLVATADTRFFHDPETFDDLHEQVLPALIKARRSSGRLRIWSAATATGQEAYSVAMLLHEHFADLAHWTVEVIATDVSHPAILRAAAGRYSQTEVQLGLPIRQLLRHFQSDVGVWQVRDELRRRIKFQPLDLLEPFRQLGLFDVILCRHVLGTFSPAEKCSVLERLSQSLRPDGYLLLGAEESAWEPTPVWERVESCRSVTYVPAAPRASRLRITGRATA